MTSLVALGCASTRCTISILGNALCGIWGECVVGRVTNISKRSVFVANTLSVVQAIQLEDVSVLAERKGMSWIPTLKIGRGRRGGAPSWSKKGDKDWGRDDNSASAYTLNQLARAADTGP